jgi:hypothetical protein
LAEGVRSEDRSLRFRDPTRAPHPALLPFGLSFAQFQKVPALSAAARALHRDEAMSALRRLEEASAMSALRRLEEASMHFARISGTLSTMTLALACSSTSPAPGPGTSTGPSPTPTIAPTASPGVVPSTPGTTTPTPTTLEAGAPTAGGCEATTTNEACETCCEQKFPAGAQAAQAAIDAWQQCVCTKCSAQCASSACSPNQDEPTAACQTCMDAATECDDKYEQVCNADQSCAAMGQCVETSKCGDKP